MDKVGDDDPLQGAIGYFGVGKMMYPMYIDIVQKKKWWLFFRDITGFWRNYTVKAGDKRVQILKPVKKWGSELLKPLMYFGNPPHL